MSTWYISTTGSDESGDGSIGNPYLTITKGLDVSVNGDTIYLIPTHTNYSYTDPFIINKEITITTGTTTVNSVWISGTNTIFIIQSNNVIISNLLLESDYPSIVIDPMSTGNNEPTFWTGISIDNCDISYKNTALSLSGMFTVSNCNFSYRYEDPIDDNVSIINLYGVRDTCNINDNFISTWMYPTVRYINLTSQGDVEGDYFDKCNSKGGTLNIYNNKGYYTWLYGDTPATFINMDYFNQYNFVVNPDMIYNPNTKLILNIYENVVQFVVINSNLVNIDNKSNSDYATFNKVNIYNNSLNTTNFGALHLGKQVNGSKLTIDQIDLERNIFKVYDNTLVYPNPAVNKVFQWDASNRNSMKDADNKELLINGELNNWIDIVNNVNIINGSEDKAVLEQEERGGNIYTYIRTKCNFGAHLLSEAGIFKLGYTIYLVFREPDSLNCPGYTVYPYVKSDLMSYLGFVKYNNNSTFSNSILYGSDYSPIDETDYFHIQTANDKNEYLNAQVWAITYDTDKWVYVYNSDNKDVTQAPVFNIYKYIKQLSNTPLQPLKFGYSNNDVRFASSLCLYEIVVYDGNQTGSEIMNRYTDLQYKWGIRTTYNTKHLWDTNFGAYIQDINGNPVIVGNPIDRWVNITYPGNANLINAGIYPATLESEVRNGITYKYIKTVSNTMGYLVSEIGIVQSGHTMFMVFRESDDPIAGNADRIFMNDDTEGLKAWHGSDNQGYIHNDNINDYQTGRYSVRVWAIKITGDKPYRCLIPSAGATSFRLIKDLVTTVDIPNPSILKLGQIDDNFPSSICLYEIIILEGLLNDTEMMSIYDNLYNKWGVSPPTIPVKVFNFDASVSNSILDDNNNPVLSGNPITKWVDTVSGINMVNGGINKAILDSEVRNMASYNFIRTINNVNGYLCTVGKTLTKLGTMYIVFREDDTIYDINVGTQLACTQYLSENEYFMDLQHKSITGSGYWDYELPDTQSTSFTTRIWAKRFNSVTNSTILVPNAGDVQNPVLFTGDTTVPICSEPRHLFFGKTSSREIDDKPSSICLYEVRIYDGLHSDAEMLAEYAILQSKWGI